MSNLPSPTAPHRRGWICLLMFVVLVGLYLVWCGRYYDTEALKQAMWNYPGPSVQSVRHAWSHVWYWYWWGAVSPFAGSDFDTRMSWMTLLNALLAAGGVVLVMDCLRVQGVKTPVAAATGLLLGGAAAWFHQSSQPMEPMMAEFWLLLSVRLSLVGGRRESVATAGAAICWALAVAAYQTYVFAGPGLLILIGTRWRRALLWLAVAAGAGVTLSCLAAYGFGVRSLGGLIEYLTAKDDAGYWGFFRLSAVAQTGLGVVNAISPPWPNAGWPGLRDGWKTLGGGARAYLLGHVAFWALAVFVVVLRPSRPENRRFYWAAFAMFLGGLFFPFYLLPYYSKLWLLPLGALALLVGLAADRGHFARGLLFIFLGWMLLRNGTQVYAHFHRTDNPSQVAAMALEKSIGPNDLLVCDGWDHSNLFLTRNPRQPKFAVMTDSKDPQVLAELIRTARARQARVWFFGLLEQTPERWAANDSGKRGTTVPYEALQAYRPKARLVWMGAEHGFTGDLYELTGEGAVSPAP